MSTAFTMRHFQGNDFVTYRRWWLERLLSETTGDLSGDVVDLGGENENVRGSNERPSTKSWICVNIDETAGPDIVGSVYEVPLEDGCADAVLCMEVLEHLDQPERCVAEAFRLLKPGGRMIASAPFLYPVHGDPDDYYRYTPSALRKLFADFENLRIQDMGGSIGTVAMLGEKALMPWIHGNISQRGLRKILLLILRALSFVDARNCTKERQALSDLTTGYFLTATKPE